MQIPDPTTNLRLLLAQTRNQVLSSLRPGQVVQARVVETRPGEALLAIGARQLLVKTPAPLTPGATLQLRVVEAKQGVELALARPSATASERPESAALRHALPRQRPLAALLTRLDGAAAPRPQMPATGSNPTASVATPSTPAPPGTTTTPPATPPPTSPTLPLGAMREIVASLPGQGGRLDGEAVRQAFQRSGLFLEANLLQGRVGGDDLKLSLLRLLQQLRGAVPPSGNKPTPTGTQATTSPPPAPLSELLTATESGIARLVVHQLSSLPSNDGTPQVWQFDLPLRSPEGWDNLLLRFEREERPGGDETEPAWSVTLELALEELGPLRVRLRLIGDTLSGQFTASRPDSARRIGEAMPRLSERLRQAGLQVGRMQVAQGEIRPQDRVAPPSADGGLLSEKA